MTVRPRQLGHQRPGRRAGWALVLVAALVLAGCSGSDGSDGSRGRGAREPVRTSTTRGASRPTSSSTVPEEPGFPDLRGGHLDDAVKLLDAAGFKRITALDTAAGGRVVAPSRAWTVVDQSAPAHEVVPTTTAITLFVAKAPTPETTPAKVGYVQVPEILYEPVGEGLDALVAEGLTNVLLEDFSGKQRLVPADASWVITSLTPSPGSWIKPTDQVRLGALPKGDVPTAGR